MRLRAARLNFTVPILALAGAIVVLSVLMFLGELQRYSPQTLGYLGLFLVAIALGENARVAILTGRESAPMSGAAALALALSSMAGVPGPRPGATTIIATISLGMVLGGGVLVVSGHELPLRDIAARLVGMATAPMLYRSLTFDGRSLVDWQATWVDQRWLVAVIMLLVGAAAMLVEFVLEAALRAGRDHSPVIPAIVDEVRTNVGLASALVTSGALIALAEHAIGLAALPLFLFPLAFTYFAVQRYATIRHTYRQTIGALSTLTDKAGYTAPAHAQRVSELALAIGRDLGMGQRELTDLEYAALLHDLGQVALREPIPGGATLMAAPGDQQRIAHDGAEIVRTTGVLDNVARILEVQTAPYRQVREFGQDLPMASRIIKVANAYDDMAGPGGANDERAMERIHLGLGYEYDPRVVDSLTSVLRRRRRGGYVDHLL